MKRQHIVQIEAYLEHTIEGAFASLFGRRISAHDLAVKLARAMLERLHTDEASTQQQAPDSYVIHLRPDVHAHLMAQEPELVAVLSLHLLHVAERFGYQLAQAPSVKLVISKDLAPGQLRVTAAHTTLARSSTAALTPVSVPKAPPGRTKSAQLLVGEIYSVSLEDDLVNIGRDPSNHIVVDDPYVSRHHMQLRRRAGDYLLFDVNSQGGTYVNGARVREHRLQAGDVIDIGKTRLLYLEDPNDQDYDTGSTQTLDPDIS
ncbi:DUF3662 domain-containing protein [bacterium]|nr:DUF3662 domain-containing protein [bacterium]